MEKTQKTRLVGVMCINKNSWKNKKTLKSIVLQKCNTDPHVGHARQGRIVNGPREPLVGPFAVCVSNKKANLDCHSYNPDFISLPSKKSISSKQRGGQI